MFHLKAVVILIFVVAGTFACFNSKPERYRIADSKTYEASLFRQHCSICHGPEGDGKTLTDGKVIPSLRQGDLKRRTRPEIFQQISDGGNGMTPFRPQLTDREINTLADLVHDNLRR